MALLVCAIAEPAAPVRAQQARRPRALPVESMDPYRDAASRLIGAALADRFAWERLAELTDTIGHRLSGSAQLERAVQWALEEMRRDGLEHVRAEPVLVPRWVRGRERAQIVDRPSTRSRCSGWATASPPRPRG